MKVCAKCATSEEFVKIVLAGGKGLREGQTCDVCFRPNMTVFERTQ